MPKINALKDAKTFANLTETLSHKGANFRNNPNNNNTNNLIDETPIDNIPPTINPDRNETILLSSHILNAATTAITK